MQYAIAAVLLRKAVWDSPARYLPYEKKPAAGAR